MTWQDIIACDRRASGDSGKEWTTDQVDERVVAALWERQAFDGAVLDPLGLSVVFRGVPSDAGGPDYQDAILLWQGKNLERGDVEFHVRSSDWYRHGHDRDPRYTRVVLHVVWIDDRGETVRADGRAIPVLALDGSRVPAGSATPRPVQPSLLPHPCVAAFAVIPSEAVRERVRDLGRRRFQELVERYAAELTCRPPDEVAYGALMEGLGYASNRETFRRLADLVPYAWLQSVPSVHWPAVLLDAAGLGPPAPVAPPGHLAPRSWRIARIRPGNHPALRIRGMALLIGRLGPHLADVLSAAVLRAKRPADLRAALITREGQDPLIGPGRADELVVSVVLPLAAALQSETDFAQRAFERYPSPPENRWTRVMMGMLAEAGHPVTPRSAAEHQGLHHLYHRHCRTQRSRDCPMCGRDSSRIG